MSNHEGGHAEHADSHGGHNAHDHGGKSKKGGFNPNITIAEAATDVFLQPLAMGSTIAEHPEKLVTDAPGTHILLDAAKEFTLGTTEVFPGTVGVKGSSGHGKSHDDHKPAKGH